MMTNESLLHPFHNVDPSKTASPCEILYPGYCLTLNYAGWWPKRCAITQGWVFSKLL